MPIEGGFLSSVILKKMRKYCLLALGLLEISARCANAQVVSEVAIATPDILAVEVRDPPFAHGKIRPVDEAHNQSPGTWALRGADWQLFVGPLGNYGRSSDLPPKNFLDRQSIDDAGEYGSISDAKVVEVYRKSVPYDSGIFREDSGENSNRRKFQTLYLSKARQAAEVGAAHNSMAKQIIARYSL